MARNTSKIMDVKAQKQAAKAAELKAARKDTKSEAADTKKSVAESQKNFLANPHQLEAAKAYRTAVANHIDAVKRLNKIETQLAA